MNSDQFGQEKIAKIGSTQNVSSTEGWIAVTGTGRDVLLPCFTV